MHQSICSMWLIVHQIRGYCKRGVRFQIAFDWAFHPVVGFKSIYLSSSGMHDVKICRYVTSFSVADSRKCTGSKVVAYWQIVVFDDTSSKVWSQIQNWSAVLHSSSWMSVYAPPLNNWKFNRRLGCSIYLCLGGLQDQMWSFLLRRLPRHNRSPQSALLGPYVQCFPN